MVFNQSPDKKQKKRGSLSRVKSTPKEEGGGDKPELLKTPQTINISSYGFYFARTGDRQQAKFCATQHFAFISS